jgi:hypothetical protein
MQRPIMPDFGPMGLPMSLVSKRARVSNFLWASRINPEKPYIRYFLKPSLLGRPL